MSKMSELSQAIDEMIACGEGMIKVANALRAVFSSEEPDRTNDNERSDDVSEQKSTETGTAVSAGPEQPKIAFTDVRKAFAAKSHAGYTAQIRALLSDFGADKLSAVPEEKYPELMAALEAIE